MHAPIHIVEAPNIDKTENSVVVELIDNYHTCALPVETKYSEMNNLVKKVHSCHYTTTCRKKKGVASTSNAPWAQSEKPNIVRKADVK